MSARLLSINIGTPKKLDWAGKMGWTAIDKHSIAGPVDVHELGIEGDQIADTENHGGYDQAVYAFGREDLDVWSERLGLEIRNGQFGENLTTSGIDVNEALVGERWRIGTTTFEVADVRIPCSVFANWMHETGFDNDKWIKRFTADARPGPYLRVVEPGQICAGDELTVVFKPDHDISVTTMFKALTTQRELLPRMFEVGDGLAKAVRDVAEAAASRAAHT